METTREDVLRLVALTEAVQGGVGACDGDDAQQQEQLLMMDNYDQYLVLCDRELALERPLLGGEK